MTQPGTATGQYAIGRAIVQTVPGIGNFMAWTGASPDNWLNLYMQPDGYTFPTPDSDQSDSQDTSLYGPAMVLSPSQSQVSLFWTASGSGEICWTEASPNEAGTTIDWIVGRGGPAIPGAVAATGPTACLANSGGQLVEAVIWQDRNLDSLALWTKPVWGDQVGTDITALGVSCVDCPTLVTTGPWVFLAFFDNAGDFNLATAEPSGTGPLTFDMAGRFTSAAIKGSLAPAFVPFGNRYGFVFWAQDNGIAYELLYLDSQNQWQIDDAAASGGLIDGAIASGAPCASVIESLIDGVTTKQILLAWPQKDSSPEGMVGTYIFTPDTSSAAIAPTATAKEETAAP